MLTLAFLFSVAVVAPTDVVAAGQPAMAGKWQVGAYDEFGRFSLDKAAHYDGGDVGFRFLERPDTSYLVTDHSAYRDRLLGDLTGETLVATVVVAVSPGTEFEYWGEPDGSGRAANVRLYFYTNTLLGTPQPAPSTQGFSSFWWSYPTSIDMADLKDGAVTLTVPLDPAVWLDCQNIPGDHDAAHLDSFAQAVADVDGIGLSFGGGYYFHNGLGIRPGTGSGTFHLVSFTAG